jgi:hypothetical protein
MPALLPRPVPGPCPFLPDHLPRQRSSLRDLRPWKQRPFCADRARRLKETDVPPPPPSPPRWPRPPCGPPGGGRRRRAGRGGARAGGGGLERGWGGAYGRARRRGGGRGAGPAAGAVAGGAPRGVAAAPPASQRAGRGGARGGGAGARGPGGVRRVRGRGRVAGGSLGGGAGRAAGAGGAARGGGCAGGAVGVGRRRVGRRRSREGARGPLVPAAWGPPGERRCAGAGGALRRGLGRRAGGGRVLWGGGCGAGGWPVLGGGGVVGGGWGGGGGPLGGAASASRGYGTAGTGGGGGWPRSPAGGAGRVVRSGRFLLWRGEGVGGGPRLHIASGGRMGRLCGKWRTLGGQRVRLGWNGRGLGEGEGKRGSEVRPAFVHPSRPLWCGGGAGGIEVLSRLRPRPRGSVCPGRSFTLDENPGGQFGRLDRSRSRNFVGGGRSSGRLEWGKPVAAASGRRRGGRYAG